MSKRISGKLKVSGIRYFKNNWGIVECVPVENKNEKPIVNNYGTFILKGTMVQPKTNIEYEYEAEEIEDEKWGLQYEVKQLRSTDTLVNNSDFSKRKYLEAIFTPGIVYELYEALEDPFTTLANKDVGALLAVKGCGMRTAPRWVEKFHEDYGLCELIVGLNDITVARGAMKRITRFYGSPEVALDVIQNHPYELTKVYGIGFTKADQIAMSSGNYTEHCPQRVSAYVRYVLDEQGQLGKSYVSSYYLMDKIIEYFGEDITDLEVSEGMNEEDLKEDLWYTDDKEFVGLKKYYNLEKHIADNVTRLLNSTETLVTEDWKERIKEQEIQQGWEFTDQQYEAIETVMHKNLTVVVGGAGCVDCDTEFFTGFGWKRIADYEEGDKVLQYNENGTAELVTPYRYIKNKADTLYHFETKYGLSQTLSLNHNVAYLTSRGHLAKIPFNEMIKRHENSANGFNGKFLTTFDYSGSGIDLTDEEIRLMVAIFADGHFEKCTLKEGNKTYGRVRFNLKKRRKKDRLEWLLNQLQINYKKSNKPTVEGYHEYYFIAPYISKHYTKEWYTCDKHQLRIIAEEVMYWDGCVQRNSYSTTNKEDADFIQYVYTTLGYRATIGVNDRAGQSYLTSGKQYTRKSVEYEVHYTARSTIGMAVTVGRGTPKTKITEVKTKDGYEYCFTVPSGYLVLRNNNRIFITGNCGKSTVAGAIIKLMRDKRVALCALSGKAALRLEELAECQGQTIHRLLGLGEDSKPKFNSENLLYYDLIVVDEISMIGGNLFDKLLDAISPKTKVLLLGDTGQLEAIGSCNVAADLIKSGRVPVVTLTKIHRQAAKSGIITESTHIRQGVQIVSSNFVGEKTLGELQDLHLDCYSDKSNTVHKVLDTFKRELSKYGDDVLKVQILMANKSNGESSTYNVNALVQNLVNPNDNEDEKIVCKSFNTGKFTTFKVGDKVINCKNNYKAQLYDPIMDSYSETSVFNGNIGIITKIDKLKDCVFIDFERIGMIRFSIGDMSNFDLAYAVTVHKYQGSQVEEVIFGLDYGSYMMLSRQLVYTAITRATKECHIIAQTSAFRMAVGTDKISEKLTHLAGLINEHYEPKEVQKNFSW